MPKPTREQRKNFIKQSFEVLVTLHGDGEWTEKQLNICSEFMVKQTDSFHEVAE